jgi:hypothetical protein
VFDQESKSEKYSDIAQDLDTFLEENFFYTGNPVGDQWRSSLRELLTRMLDQSPENRPNASEVWQHLKEMVEALGATPHCIHVSPVASIPSEEILRRM